MTLSECSMRRFVTITVLLSSAFFSVRNSRACFFVQFMAFLIVIFLGEIVGGVLAIVFKDSVSYTLCTDI